MPPPYGVPSNMPERKLVRSLHKTKNLANQLIHRNYRRTGQDRSPGKSLAGSHEYQSINMTNAVYRRHKTADRSSKTGSNSRRNPNIFADRRERIHEVVNLKRQGKAMNPSSSTRLFANN